MRTTTHHQLAHMVLMLAVIKYEEQVIRLNEASHQKTHV